MSLLTGKRIHKYQWTVLPISMEVLARVNQLALEEGQPLVAQNFKYEWRPGQIVADDAADLDITENENIENIEDDDDGECMRILCFIVLATLQFSNSRLSLNTLDDDDDDDEDDDDDNDNDDDDDNDDNEDGELGQ